MFTGIIESVGVVAEKEAEGTNVHFKINSSISQELKVDQSIAHEGVCLTVTKLESDAHWVTAIDETIQRSNLSSWVLGRKVNLERCMKADGRFDGHIVQGHVDSTALVKSIDEQDGSWLYTFESSTELMVDKGSICINGTSLTCFEITSSTFKVAIIPYTYEHTTFHQLKPGDSVNIEFDILGKYIQKMLNR